MAFAALWQCCGGGRGGGNQPGPGLSRRCRGGGHAGHAGVLMPCHIARSAPSPKIVPHVACTPHAPPLPAHVPRVASLRTRRPLAMHVPHVACTPHAPPLPAHVPRVASLRTRRPLAMHVPHVACTPHAPPLPAHVPRVASLRTRRPLAMHATRGMHAARAAPAGLRATRGKPPFPPGACATRGVPAAPRPRVAPTNHSPTRVVVAVWRGRECLGRNCKPARCDGK